MMPLKNRMMMVPMLVKIPATNVLKSTIRLLKVISMNDATSGLELYTWVGFPLRMLFIVIST